MEARLSIPARTRLPDRQNDAYAAPHFSAGIRAASLPAPDQAVRISAEKINLYTFKEYFAIITSDPRHSAWVRFRMAGKTARPALGPGRFV